MGECNEGCEDGEGVVLTTSRDNTVAQGPVYVGEITLGDFRVVSAFSELNVHPSPSLV